MSHSPLTSPRIQVADHLLEESLQIDASRLRPTPANVIRIENCCREVNFAGPMQRQMTLPNSLNFNTFKSPVKIIVVTRTHFSLDFLMRHYINF